MEKKTIMKTFGIVIADRGWVYVGDIEIDGDWMTISNAKNIRRWGTTAGLGEIAQAGPNNNTKLDNYGIIHLPISSVTGGIIECEKKLWE